MDILKYMLLKPQVVQPLLTLMCLWEEVASLMSWLVPHHGRLCYNMFTVCRVVNCQSTINLATLTMFMNISVQ